MVLTAFEVQGAEAVPVRVKVANPFLISVGPGWYVVTTLFGEVMKLPSPPLFVQSNFPPTISTNVAVASVVVMVSVASLIDTISSAQIV